MHNPQVVAPGALVAGESHFSHVIALWFFEIFPLSQSVHSCDPDEEENFPGSQAVQFVCPFMEDDPASQSSQ